MIIFWTRFAKKILSVENGPGRVKLSTVLLYVTVLYLLYRSIFDFLIFVSKVNFVMKQSNLLLSSLHFSLQTIDTLLCPLYWREVVPWLTIDLDTTSTSSSVLFNADKDMTIHKDHHLNDADDDIKTTDSNVNINIAAENRKYASTILDTNNKKSSMTGTHNPKVAMNEVNESRRVSLRTRGFFHISMSLLKIECSTERFIYDELLIDSLRRGNNNLLLLSL